MLSYHGIQRREGLECHMGDLKELVHTFWTLNSANLYTLPPLTLKKGKSYIAISHVKESSFFHVVKGLSFFHVVTPLTFPRTAKIQICPHIEEFPLSTYCQLQFSTYRCPPFLDSGGQRPPSKNNTGSFHLFLLSMRRRNRGRAEEEEEEEEEEEGVKWPEEGVITWGRLFLLDSSSSCQRIV